MIENLRVKDVNNLHLVCRNLHHIANLHVNPKLRFNLDSLEENLESLVQFSRVFEALKFNPSSGDYLLSSEKFEAIEEYISFTGAHIKRLIIRNVRVDQKVVQKLMNLLPNLKSLELSEVRWVDQEQLIEFNVKSTKIEQLKFNECTGFANLLESLEKCAIKELDLHCQSNTESKAMKKFLKVQEKNLRKLTIEVADQANWLNDLKDLRLEHLECRTWQFVSLGFLKCQENLKFLKLTMWNSSDAHFEMIWKLNILDNLQFGIFNDLEELDAYFYRASLDSIREMKRITPNLKKLVIDSHFSYQINALLETLENLESVEIKNGYALKIPSEKFYPKMKYLHTNNPFDSNFSAEQILKTFPNLETLKIDRCSLDVTESFLVTLLSELKQLKTLRLEIWSRLELDRETALQCLQQHGDNLEDVKLVFRFRHLENVHPYAINKRQGGFFASTIQRIQVIHHHGNLSTTESL